MGQNINMVFQKDCKMNKAKGINKIRNGRLDKVRNRFIGIFARKYLKLLELDKQERNLLLSVVIAEYSDEMELLSIDVVDIVNMAGSIERENRERG